MARRILDFSDGFTSASPPTTGADFVVTGTNASPVSVTVAGITPQGYAQELIFVQGSGGPIDISANPQIAAGTDVGQTLMLIGKSDTNTLLLEDGTGLGLNGACTLVDGSVIKLVWTGAIWLEVSRNDV